MQKRQVEKIQLVETKITVSFSYLMWRWSLLKSKHCVWLEIASIFPSLVFEKKKSYRDSFLESPGNEI